MHATKRGHKNWKGLKNPCRHCASKHMSMGYMMIGFKTKLQEKNIQLNGKRYCMNLKKMRFSSVDSDIECKEEINTLDN